MDEGLDLCEALEFDTVLLGECSPMFLQTVGNHLPDHTASFPRGHETSNLL